MFGNRNSDRNPDRYLTNREIRRGLRAQTRAFGAFERGDIDAAMGHSAQAEAFRRRYDASVERHNPQPVDFFPRWH